MYYLTWIHVEDGVDGGCVGTYQSLATVYFRLKHTSKVDTKFRLYQLGPGVCEIEEDGLGVPWFKHTN